VLTDFITASKFILIF